MMMSKALLMIERYFSHNITTQKKKNTTFKIKSSNNSTISSLKASKTLFRAYQFKPLLKFINSPSRRLLVADEVGLGKTIEAGHIMLELKARKQLNDVLIVCPMSLQEKWKAELIEKFALPFKIYDSSKDLIDDLENGHGNIHAIINYEKIRLKKTKDLDTSISKKKKYSNIIDYLMVNGHRFSLVLYYVMKLISLEIVILRLTMVQR